MDSWLVWAVCIWLSLGVVAWAMVMDYCKAWRAGWVSYYLIILPFALLGGVALYSVLNEIGLRKDKCAEKERKKR